MTVYKGEGGGTTIIFMFLNSFGILFVKRIFSIFFHKESGQQPLSTETALLWRHNRLLSKTNQTKGYVINKGIEKTLKY